MSINPQSLLQHSLCDRQNWFASIISSPLDSLESGRFPIYAKEDGKKIRAIIKQGPDLNAEERIGLYQQQYWWRLLNVLQKLYPSLLRLYGYKDFNEQIAVPYLMDHRPKHWFLANIGHALPEWIAKHIHEKSAAIAVQLAQLDQLYENLTYALRHAPLSTEDGANIENRILALQPFVVLTKTTMAILEFRSQLLKNSCDHWQQNDFPKLSIPSSISQFVLFRNADQDCFEEMSMARYQILQEFQHGTRLDNIQPLIEECDGVFEWFCNIASRGWIYSPYKNLN